MVFDPMYLILVLLPGLVLSGLASLFVKYTFNKYSKVGCANGMTGAQAADAMLRANGVYDVRIQRTSGFLTDHFNPSDNTLNLSAEVYDGRSLSSIGVACHEAGHALQKATGYPWMGVRSTLVPVANIGSNFSYYVILAGLLFQAQTLAYVGCALFGCAVAFSVVTLPVEWDASARAKRAMVDAGLLRTEERDHAATVLNAAFLTYIASAVSSLLTLLYYILRARSIGSRRD
ncbi:MAG: zinc metallopeptidase [Victivallales bacterium]|nr:zinc metallopeptidase [Victivallales bacterium]